MTISLVIFSDSSMSRAADLCEISARQNGIHRAWHWTKQALWTSPFYRAHKDILDAPRGVGYWLWKPYLIKIALDSSRDGDTYIYSDAGIEFINNVNYIIDRMGHDKPQDDIWLFGNNWEHAHWCKRDVVEAVWPTPKLTRDERVARIIELERAGRHDILEIVDDMLRGYASESQTHDILWSNFGKQAQASVIFFCVSDYTRSFVAEWLKWCLFEGGRLIDDSPSRLPNHPEFQEHRHDQAILTTLAYREGIKLHWWPAVYNRFVPCSPVFTYEKGGYTDDYPPLFHHHRLRDHEWKGMLPPPWRKFSFGKGSPLHK